LRLNVIPFLSAKAVVAAVSLLILAALPVGTASAQADEILLKDFRPRSVHEVPRTEITRARFPVIDIHSHPYPNSVEDVERWVEIMDEFGIERTVVLTGAVGATLDSLNAVYSRFGERFEVWCGLDLRGYDEPDFGPAAVAELERCVAIGGKGVGEIHDKGAGLRSAGLLAAGMHPDDPRMDPVFRRAAELGIPINIHIAEPIWMYQPMDSTNDGLMTSYRWRLDDQPDIVGHEGMIGILESLLARHPETTFIVVHLASLCHDLGRLGTLLESHPNMYTDVSARFSEIAQTPRFARKILAKHGDRVLYGTDLGFSPEMYRTTFRILETDDDHFYAHQIFGQHWALRGLHLDEETLRKLYRDNAAALLAERDRRMALAR
jgi:uncharacterized protein